MKKLFLIPARGGSKGLPRKNLLPIAGKPMICYTIDAAKEVSEPGDEICVSTDDEEIIQVVEKYGVKVPFIRPEELSSDTSGSQEFIDHALNWYEERNQNFELVVLLQVTSPLRNATHVKEAIALLTKEVDMVVSVKETDSNPYYVLFEEDSNGFLQKSKDGAFTRRQDCPKVYEYNGAIYVIRITAIKSSGTLNLSKKRKYIMNKKSSIDVDDFIDYKLAQILMADHKNEENSNNRSGTAGF